MTAPIGIADLRLGPGLPLGLIAGPCLLESRDHALMHAEALQRAARRHGLPFVFKASFDKANRTSRDAARGPGLDAGLEMLRAVRDALGVPVTTDVHLPEQVAAVAEVVDLVQIPAFLCRQTDLLLAAGASGRPVNLKKGQFVAPEDMAFAAEKVGSPVILTERGAAFGYRDLVVDPRTFARWAGMGFVTCIDATHAAQSMGGAAGRSGGDRSVIPVIARAGVAAGADVLFAEVHADPPNAPSDAAVQWPLDAIDVLLAPLVRIREALLAS